MRVSARAAQASGSRSASPTREVAREKRFADALRARGRGTSEARGGAALAGRAVAVRRTGADAGAAALLGRREEFRDAERAPSAPAAIAAAAPPRAAADVPPAATPELRALVRALPLAIDASRVRDGAPLALSLGRSLDVELRPSPRGVELVLRPEARLARVCAAELPRVVAALAARGLSVARAEVRARPEQGSARVDVPSALR